MAKKIKIERINLPVNGTTVALDYEDDGYYLGANQVGVGDVSFHVEAVAVTVRSKKIVRAGEYYGLGVVVKAKNPTYQERIQRWEKANKGHTPKLVEDEGGPYFVSIEAYAA